MPKTQKLVVAVTTRVLFNLEAEHKIYQEEGLEAFLAHQEDARKKKTPLRPGCALGLVQKLLRISRECKNTGVEVILLSKNHPHITGRLHDAMEKWGLEGITRQVFTGGSPLLPHVKAWECDLFLSSCPVTVQNVIDHGVCAAAVMKTSPDEAAPRPNEGEPLRFTIDGDEVIFDAEAQKIYDEHGLDAFLEHEHSRRHRSLGPGPFWAFLKKLLSIRDGHPGTVRVALVTSRGAPAQLRALHTLMEAGMFVDEAAFVGGADKTPTLQAFGADVFFDDSADHISRASSGKIASGRVPSSTAKLEL